MECAQIAFHQGTGCYCDLNQASVD
jgi:hypothetical protein